MLPTVSLRIPKLYVASSILVLMVLLDTNDTIHRPLMRDKHSLSIGMADLLLLDVVVFILVNMNGLNRNYSFLCHFVSRFILIYVCFFYKDVGNININSKLNLRSQTTYQHRVILHFRYHRKCMQYTFCSAMHYMKQCDRYMIDMFYFDNPEYSIYILVLPAQIL